MAARLQHLLHDIAMPAGTFLIGRGADCQLALDDVLVSRRHASIRVAEDGASVLEDLGSRNGVFLNGVRIVKPAPLHDGDLIRIGSQDICFYNASDADAPSAPRATRVTMQYIPSIDAASVPPPEPEPEISSAPSGRLPPTAPTPSVDQLQPFEPDDPGDATTIAASPLGAGGVARMVTGLTIIGSVADKALALGRAEEADRILSRSLADILSRASKSEVDAELAERAATYALRLAVGTGRGAWIDYVFQLYTQLRVLLPARLVDELYAAVRKVKSTDKAVLRAYTNCLKQISGGFGPAERFVQQRIEGFERWAP
ncbi:MAG: FHA domain-containing protein [Minicystis sp.]